MTKAELYKVFQSLPNVYEKEDYWFQTRCVLCGDSQKDPNKRRLYIKLDPTNPTTSVGFRCFNCMEHGVLTPDMLRKIGLGDSMYTDALKEINTQAARLSGSQKTNKYRKMKAIPVEIPPLIHDPIYMRKAAYLYRERIGHKIPIEDLPSLKIVWKLTDFLKTNHLSINSRWKYFIPTLDEDYIGFLSIRNEYIIFRDITGKNKFRYIKYGMMRGMENASSYYGVDNSFSILTTEPVELIIAEGPFDTIGILYHLYGGDKKNRKFISSSEGDFAEPLMYYINQGLVGDNVSISCYVDNDTIYNYHEMINRLNPYVKNISFYHNTKGKDFGVSKDEIEVEPFDIAIADQNRVIRKRNEREKAK